MVSKFNRDRGENSTAVVIITSVNSVRVPQVQKPQVVCEYIYVHDVTFETEHTDM